MTVIFLHSPRTGGTSMIEILSQQYGQFSTEFFWEDGVWVLTEKGAAALSKGQYSGKCVLGHVPYGVHKNIPGGHTYVTMLRNPVDRVTSLYHYVTGLSGAGREWWATQGVKHHISLDDFADLPLCHLRNSMTRQFAGMPFRHQKVTKKVTKLAFTKAGKNLNGMLVGILEYFDESIRMFQDELSWDEVEILQLNDREHPTPSGKSIEKIKGHNAWDIKLYGQYRTKFERR